MESHDPHAIVPSPPALSTTLDGALRPDPPPTVDGTSPWPRRLVAVLEVLVVFGVGLILSRIATQALGLSPAAFRSGAATGTREMSHLAGSMAGALTVQYLILLSLASAVGWWHRRRPISSWGVTRGGRSWPHLVAAGIGAFAVGGLLGRVLFFLAHDVGLGGGPPQWALLDGAWDRGFWALMAVAGFGLVPVVEELFFRGYAQQRMTEDHGATRAIVITAVLFTVSHTQYLAPHPIAIGLIVALLLASLALGWVRHATGSVIPGIIAHALLNVPSRGTGTAIAIVLILGALVMMRRPLVEQARRFWGLWRAPGVARDVLLTSLFLVALVALALGARPATPFLAALLAVFVFVAEWRERRVRG